MRPKACELKVGDKVGCRTVIAVGRTPKRAAVQLICENCGLKSTVKGHKGVSPKCQLCIRNDMRPLHPRAHL